MWARSPPAPPTRKTPLGTRAPGVRSCSSVQILSLGKFIQAVPTSPVDFLLSLFKGTTELRERLSSPPQCLLLVPGPGRLSQAGAPSPWLLGALAAEGSQRLPFLENCPWQNRSLTWEGPCHMPSVPSILQPVIG